MVVVGSVRALFSIEHGGEVMPALGMSHVAFCVSDLERSLAFYRLTFRTLFPESMGGFRGVPSSSTSTGRSARFQAHSLTFPDAITPVWTLACQPAEAARV